MKNKKNIHTKYTSKLKSLAHSLKPIINIGKNGVTINILQEIKAALSVHELIKIKFYGDSKNDTEIENALNNILDEIDCIVVSKTGFIVTLFLQKEKNSKFEDI